MAAKKKAGKPIVRIPKGSMNCTYESVAWLVENLLNKGFTLADLSKVRIGLDYINCLYDEEPDTCVEWEDIV